MYVHFKTSKTIFKNQNLELELKTRKYVSRSKIKVKCQKLRVTSSVIVTNIPIKPQQFPTSSF